jgi:archaellum component FlaC
MTSQVTARSQTAAQASAATDSPLPAHFAPRPRQDPVGMSALFVVVTVVCALGASSILISTRDGGSGIAGAFDNLLATVMRIGTSAEASDQTGSINATEADTGPRRSLTPVLAAALHGSAQAASDELERVGEEINSLKTAVADVKKDVAAVKSLAARPSPPATGAVDTAAAIGAAVEPLKAEIRDLAAVIVATTGDVAALRSSTHTLYASVDQVTSSHLRDIDAINQRIGKVEDVISIRADVTAAIPTRSLAPLPKRRPRPAGWVAEEIAPGLYVLKGPHASYEVRDGSVVPGIGRIRLVRTADGQLRILSGKDAVDR